MAESIDYISYYGVPDGEKMFEGACQRDYGRQGVSAAAVDKIKPQFEANMNKLLQEIK